MSEDYGKCLGERIKNEVIHGRIGVETDGMENYRKFLRWFGHLRKI